MWAFESQQFRTGCRASQQVTLSERRRFRAIRKHNAMTGIQSGGNELAESERTWTVADHLEDADPQHIALYRAVERAILGCGPVTISVSKSTITFTGARRGFAGARPTRSGVQGYLDLGRSLLGDPRIRSAAPYTKRLWVNHFRLATLAELDETFLDWVQEAFRVGEGDHLLRPAIRE